MTNYISNKVNQTLNRFYCKYGMNAQVSQIFLSTRLYAQFKWEISRLTNECSWELKEPVYFHKIPVYEDQISTWSNTQKQLKNSKQIEDSQTITLITELGIFT